MYEYEHAYIYIYIHTQFSKNSHHYPTGASIGSELARTPRRPLRTDAPTIVRSYVVHVPAGESDLRHVYPFYRPRAVFAHLQLLTFCILHQYNMLILTLDIVYVVAPGDYAMQALQGTVGSP
jgi:hypothetical protein